MRRCRAALPMLCANPDLTMFGAHGLIPAPRARWQRFYAEPRWPRHALSASRTRRSSPLHSISSAIRRRRAMLMVGDSLDHDVAGGRAAGMLTLFLRAGVHRDDAGRLSDHDRPRAPHWTMTQLIW